MSSYVLTDAKIWVEQFDLSGDMNSVALEEAADPKDATTFGQTTRIRKGGLLDVRMQAEGFFNANGSTAVDDLMAVRLGGGPGPVSIAPQGQAEGNVAYCFPAAYLRYQIGAPVGEMFAFSLEASTQKTVSGSTPTRPRLARGQIILGTQKTATGSGTAFQLGAIAAGQKLYAAIHVVALNGSPPTIRIQSDNASGFPSATTRATATSVSSDLLVVAGAVTDDWWRADWTFSGTSFTAIVVAGIR